MTVYNKKILYIIPLILLVLLAYFLYHKRASRNESIADLIIHARTPFERGFAFEKAGLWDLAFREYEKAFRLGSKEESEEILEALLEDIYRKAGVKGDDPEKRGLRLERSGAKVLAKREYERLFQPPIYHYSIGVLNRLLRCYVELGEYEKKALLEERIKKEFSPSKRVEVNFGDRLMLFGYDIDKEETKRGNVVSLTYYWKGIGEMSREYAIFVHFIKGDRIFFQNDHYPLDGRFMTTKWHSDEVLKESYTVVVPEGIPTGEYEIRIGVWDPEKKKRLRIKGVKTAGEKDSIVIGILRIV